MNDELIDDPEYALRTRSHENWLAWLEKAWGGMTPGVVMLDTSQVNADGFGVFAYLRSEILELVKAVEHWFTWDRLDCPACSMSTPHENVPCYCWDHMQSKERLQKALTALQKAAERQRDAEGEK